MKEVPAALSEILPLFYFEGFRAEMAAKFMDAASPDAVPLLLDFAKAHAGRSQAADMSMLCEA